MYLFSSVYVNAERLTKFLTLVTIKSETVEELIRVINELTPSLLSTKKRTQQYVRELFVSTATELGYNVSYEVPRDDDILVVLEVKTSSYWFKKIDKSDTESPMTKAQPDILLNPNLIHLLFDITELVV